jgi:hypothetical protein
MNQSIPENSMFYKSQCLTPSNKKSKGFPLLFSRLAVPKLNLTKVDGAFPLTPDEIQ